MGVKTLRVVVILTPTLPSPVKGEGIDFFDAVRLTRLSATF